MTLDRRRFLTACSRAGITSALLPGVLYTLAAQAQETATGHQDAAKITDQMIDQASLLAGVGPFSDEQKKMMLNGLNDERSSYEPIRALKLANSVAPAFVFHPLPAASSGADCGQPTVRPVTRVHASGAAAPANIEDLAFATVAEIGGLLKAQKVTSLALTQMYLERPKRHEPKLHFVITLTEERALAQARKADEQIAAGKYRGPLHGIPWGAKDLLAVKGYPTTWGAGGFEHQSFEEDATVVRRLDEAGAVLVAKLTLGALAMGDKWFGGRTRNPWNPHQGSSGSSAGPASAVAAGCVPFAIGSETLGSISSPSTRCGVTGLRPTFGFVPRTGAMALSWTMDKLGPICRGVEDCAMVLQAIYGPDGQDLSARNAAFNWNADLDWKSLRIGYISSEFEADKPPAEEPEKQSAPLTDQEKKKQAKQQRDMAAYRPRRAH